jgi:calcium-dependent protein kinase
MRFREVESFPRMQSRMQCFGKQGSAMKEYQQKTWVGRGGCGKIATAVHAITGVTRAIKIIPLATACSRPAACEGWIQKEIDHPYIAKVYDMFEDKENLYLVMELCLGSNLTERLATHWQMLYEADVACILRQILVALRHIHSNDIVHGDLVPENVMFSKSSSASDSVLKLIDFGAASKSDDTSSDLEACGCILQMLLCIGTSSGKSLDGTYVTDRLGIQRPVSKEAKSLLDQLMGCSSGQFSAGAALSHVFFKKHRPKLKKIAKVPHNFIDKLIEFESNNQFKKFALRVAAHQLDGEELEHSRDLFF